MESSSLEVPTQQPDYGWIMMVQGSRWACLLQSALDAGVFVRLYGSSAAVISSVDGTRLAQVPNFGPRPTRDVLLTRLYRLDGGLMVFGLRTLLVLRMMWQVIWPNWVWWLEVRPSLSLSQSALVCHACGPRLCNLIRQLAAWPRQPRQLHI
jgi:hypothetical protein